MAQSVCESIFLTLDLFLPRQIKWAIQLVRQVCIHYKSLWDTVVIVGHYDILLCHIIEQFTSVQQHIGGLLGAVPPLVNACEEFLTISHDINNK